MPDATSYEARQPTEVDWHSTLERRKDAYAHFLGRVTGSHASAIYRPMFQGLQHRATEYLVLSSTICGMMIMLFVLLRERRKMRHARARTKIIHKFLNIP